jgi:N-acetylglucosamine-6-phosphate deacetylase
VAVAGGRFIEVGSGPPPRRPDIELTSGFLLPGLIDMQVNGYFGVELADADPVGWAEVVRRLPETGTTAFMPTFITSPVDDLLAALRATAEFAPALTGTQPLSGTALSGTAPGGPALSGGATPERRGAGKAQPMAWSGGAERCQSARRAP